MVFFDKLQALFFVSDGPVRPQDRTAPWVGRFTVNMAQLYSYLSGGRKRIVIGTWGSPKWHGYLLEAERSEGMVRGYQRGCCQELVEGSFRGRVVRAGRAWNPAFCPTEPSGFASHYMLKG